MAIRVVITGASGLLGRQVLAEAQKREGVDAIGLALTRTENGLHKLDLTDESVVHGFFQNTHPDAIIHCAAERRPDMAASNPDLAERLNAHVPGLLAREAKEHDSFIVYVSTDYVFDGRNPPYGVADEPNPLNFYGRTKLAGERQTLRENPNAAVLRVPLLYGQVEYPGESAVDVLLGPVRDPSKQTKMDDIQDRFPTCVDDVARVLVDMVQMGVGADNARMRGIFHVSAEERMTKYAMSLMFAQILGIDNTDHLVAVRELPKEDAGSVLRPGDTQMTNQALEEAGISPSFVPFKQWWTKYLLKS
ncbi:hypothetical protein GGI15_004073 [Coemansia interrupta]|uniref:RmlD-like substrate binding domain-containing protein n=1 Tax=Coemansia interrupta TaxID=1126814 RepID=A0A9W8H5T8_9FUNG|nr:hypothetical protein GGI15_004073 [Coemansia interrupta]